jgi:hypothetical protein
MRVFLKDLKKIGNLYVSKAVKFKAERSRKPVEEKYTRSTEPTRTETEIESPAYEKEPFDPIDRPLEEGFKKNFPRNQTRYTLDRLLL